MTTMIFTKIQISKIRAQKCVWSLLLLLLFVPGKLKAQQDPQHTMYMFNAISLNPAYTGTRDALTAVLLHRRQWVDLPGAPNTTTFSLHSPIRETKVSLGVSFISDDIGPVNSNYINTYYAYRLPLGENLTLSLGINFGLYIYNASITTLSRTDALDDALNTDPNKTSPNGGTGLYLYSEKYYVGVAMPKIFQSDFEKERADMSEVERHLFITAGYVFQLNDDWALKPSLFSKFVLGAPMSQDFAAQVFYKNMFNLGVNVRINDAVSFMAAYNISPAVMVGYAYDVTTSDLSDFNDGSHEILISFDIDGIKRSKVASPRYF